MYNEIYLRKVYSQYLHSDENNIFLFPITANIVSEEEYFKYFAINEMFHHEFNSNVSYYHWKIYKKEKSDFLKEYTEIQLKIYNEVQKFNLGCSRLVNLLKSKYQKSKNDKNLLLENIKNHDVIIIDRGVKYTFEYFEIYKVVKSAFKYNDDGEPVIQCIKNPYTNENFKMHIIVNIYFTLLKIGKIPLYFFLYFKHDFSKSYLYENYNYNMFIENLKTIFNGLTPVSHLRIINNMINGSNYHSFSRASDSDKIEFLKLAAQDYYISKKIKHRLGDQCCWLSDGYIESYIRKMECIRNKFPDFGIKQFTLKTNIHKNLQVSSH